MCGIAGMAGNTDKPLLDEMLRRIVHRGPDDGGTFLSDATVLESRVALGVRRLSILDLSAAGHQPMANEDGSVWVAYNGEIYNFQELRQELLNDGHVFRSHTDTEVLVHLYEKYGEDLAQRLNGMFAFALWDARAEKLFLFRDRMGIKPLYFRQLGAQLYFGSEVKSLLANPNITAELDPTVLSQYLSLLYVPGPATMFRGIRKLLPGQRLVWHRGNVSLAMYRPQKAGVPFEASEEELASELRRLMVRATQAQMVSDVPLGLFLSGGLDSSSLLACAADSGHTGLRCFSIAFSGKDGRLEQSSDDAYYARKVAEHFRADFHEIVVSPDVVDLLPKTVYHLDDPIADHAAIATLLICTAARKDVKVLLSGQGADEIFAGYRVHLTPRVCSYLRKVPPPLRRVLLERVLPWWASHVGWLPPSTQGLTLAAGRYLQKMLPLVDMAPGQQYASARSYFSPSQLDDLLLPEVRAACQVGAEEIFLRYFAQVEDRDPVDQMLYVDGQTFLPDLNLAYSDKMSMAASVEVRVPFLDDTIVDFMDRVPADLKLKGFTQKYLLRLAMKDVLPPGVIGRRKAGFGLPVRSWIRNELRTMVGDLLSPGVLRSRGLFDPTTVQRMITENESGKRDWTLQIWGLLTLELWQQTFLDAGASATAACAPVLESHHD